MGFFKRLLGLETKPGEPVSLTDNHFESEVLGSELPCFVYFFNLWCSSCQVVGGLLNEIGPEFINRARFFKMDVNKNPSTSTRMNITGVPTIILFREGRPVEQLKGLVPLRPLREWIEKGLSPPDPQQENP